MIGSGFLGMRALKTLLVVVACAAAVTGAALAKTKPGPALPGQSPGYLTDPWPAIPNDYSKAVAKAAFAHNYGAIWAYLAPSYQKAVSESRWQKCQKQNPVAPPGVKIKSVKVANSQPVPIALPLLGHASVRTVTLQILFTRAGSGDQIALQYAYWIKNSKGQWVAVWLPSVYAQYKSGGCDPGGPARGLY
jgi:hypothetical protein